MQGLAVNQDQLEQIGIFVKSHIGQWMTEENLVHPPDTGLGKDILERIVTVEQQLKFQNEKLEAMMKQSDRRFEAMDKRFADMQSYMDKRFDAVDKRFEAVDKRFEAVDKRFDAVDKRFEAVDKRFEDILHCMEKGFEAVDKRFNRLYTFLTALFVTMLAGFIPLLIKIL